MKRVRVKRATEEQDIQIAYIAATRKYAAHYPPLYNIFHVPNGGYRSPREAGILKAMGVEPGVPDIFLAVKTTTYGGLWIEFKSRKGYQRAEQKDWQKRLEAGGYKYEVHRSWETAWNATVQYLALPSRLLVSLPPEPIRLRKIRVVKKRTPG